jgi:CspA family cold shock protein
MEGTVKFFNEAKGFGFIKPNNSNTDIFVHSSGLIDEIRENDQVEYEEERGKKGMNAVNVKVLDNYAAPACSPRASSASGPAATRKCS